MMELDGDFGITSAGVRRSAAIGVLRSAASRLSVSGTRRKSLPGAQPAERDRNHASRPLAASRRGPSFGHQYINQYNRRAGRRLAFNYRASGLGTQVSGDISAETIRAVNQDGCNDYMD